MEAVYAARPNGKKQSRPTNLAASKPEVLPGAAAETAQGLPLYLQEAARSSSSRPSGQPGDPHEQEADQVAEIAARAIGGTLSPATLVPPPSRPARTPLPVPDSGPGSPLPKPVRAVVESLLGADLSGVRVHQDRSAQQAASDLGARAFAHRDHIWLGPGQSTADVPLLAHEAAHAAQQAGPMRGSFPRHAGRYAPGLDLGPAPAVQLQEEPTPQSTTEPTQPVDNLPPAVRAALEEGREPTPEEMDAALAESDAAAVNEAAADAEIPSAEDEAGAGEEAGPEEEGEAEEEAEGEEEPGAAGGPRGEVASVQAGDSDAGRLTTGDLALIDEELAEHQRWGSAQERVGAAGSQQRAAFIAEAVGSGLFTGAGMGAAMGLGAGLGGRAAVYGAGRAAARWGTRIGANAARFTPVPAVGAIIGGAMSVYGLASRDWSATGATISRFGEGSSTYETLANSIAAISEIIDITTNVLNVVAGILGLISAALWIAAIFTAGALSPLAAVLTKISLGISVTTTILDGINAALLQPCVILFRALHAFTADADPREVETHGAELSQSAAMAGGALGGWAGGKAAAGGSRPRGRRGPPPAPDSPNPRAEGLPPAAVGEGPSVTLQSPPAPTAAPGQQLSLPGMGATPAVPARPGQQLTLPGMAPAPAPAARTAATGGAPPSGQLSLPFNRPRQLELPLGTAGRPAPPATAAAAPAPPARAGAATPAPATPPAGAATTAPGGGGGRTGGGGAGGGGPTGGGGPPGGPPEGPFARLTDAEIDAAVVALDTGQARSGAMVQAPAPTGFRTGAGQGGYWGVEPATGMTVQEYRFPSRRGLPQLDAAGRPVAGPRGDVQTRMRIHSPDSSAPPGSASREGWSMGFEQGNARMTAEGQWFDTRFHTTPGGQRLDVRPYRRATDGSWVHRDTGAPVTDASTVSALNQWDANMAASHIPLFPAAPGTPGGGAPGTSRPPSSPTPPNATGGSSSTAPAASTPPAPTTPGVTPPSARPSQPSPQHTTWIEGYTRADGVQVRGHWRRPGGTAAPAAPASTSPPAGTPSGTSPPVAPAAPTGAPAPAASVPDTPQLHANWPYGTPVPNRAGVGHNVQRDHVIAQAKLRDMLGADYTPEVRNSLTVLAETGAVSPTSARPHTQATFRDVQADVPEINRLRQQGGLGSFADDIIEPSRQARLRSGYQDPGAVDRAWVDQMGRAFSTRRMGEARVDAQGRPVRDATGRPMESVADRLARFQRESGQEVTPIPDVESMNWSDFDIGPAAPAAPPPPAGTAPPAAGPAGGQLTLPGINPAPSTAGPAGQQLSLPGITPAPPTPTAPAAGTAPAAQLSFPFNRPQQLDLPFAAAGSPAPAAAPAPSSTPTGTAPPATVAGRVAGQEARESAAPQVPQAPQEARLPTVRPSPDATPYEQQQAAHRARFTADNQPETGVVRVNPAYPAPPGTPAEISAMQEEIAALLSMRAQAQQAEADMRAEVQTHQENQAPIQEAVEETAGGISAVQAHQEAVARREQANQEQQQRQQESESLVAGYPSRATGMTALTVPLRGFQGLTHLASYLPGRAGRAMSKMNRDATSLLETFSEMDTSMTQQNEVQPERRAELEGDAATIGQVDEDAVTSEEEMTTANEGAEGLRQANQETLLEAEAARNQAAQQGDQLDGEIQEREAGAQSLAQQLQEWAVQHRAARQQAIEQTRQSAMERGLEVVEVRDQ